MADPNMTPDEMAWAYQNAGRSPQAQNSSSESFAAQARMREQQQAAHAAELERKNLEALHRQDAQWNATVHAQDMEAAKAHHRALMGQYSLVERARAELGAFTGKGGWKQGFLVGLVAGAIMGAIFIGRKR